MNQTEQSIVSTLAYYHALRVPALTFPEIFYYLTPLDGVMHTPCLSKSETIGHKQQCFSTPSFHIVEKTLQDLKEEGIIVSQGGYYALMNIGAPQKRIRDMQNQQEKGAIFSRVARLLPYIPYVRMVALAGSVAINCARPESDIDIFITGARRRIWTTRILVTLITHLTGERRYGAHIANKICLNHYTTENMSSELHNIPLAHIYAQILLYWKDAHTNIPPANNSWIRHILPNAHGMRSYVHARPANTLGLAGKKIVEKLLDYTIGPALEYTVKQYQTRRIQKNLGDTKPDQLELVLSDQELRFHYPFSRSKEALAQYRKTLKQYI